MNSTHQQVRSTFNILRNPFIVLNIPLSATVEEISEAFENALSESEGAQSELSTAKQKLLVPKLRLAAELESLLDTPHSNWRSIIVALNSTQATSRLLHAFKALQPLTQFNLVSHLGSQRSLDADGLKYWLSAHAKLHPDAILELIANNRRLAGIVGVEPTALAAALSQLCEQHSKALFDGYPTPDSCVPPITNVTEAILRLADPSEIDGLSRLLRSYRLVIGPALSEARQSITNAINELREHPQLDHLPDNFTHILARWQYLNKPLQSFEQFKDRDDAEAEALFHEIRGTAIDLANGHKRYDIAAALTNLARELFPNLKRAREKLDADENELKELIELEGARRLRDFIEALNPASLDRLARDLQESGFRPESIGESKVLYNHFVDAVKLTKGTGAAKLPWILLRGVAIQLNEAKRDPSAIISLIDGALSIVDDMLPPPDIVDRFLDDRRVLTKQILEEQFLRHLKADELDDALIVINRLNDNAKNDSEKEILQRARLDVEQRQASRRFRRAAVWAIAAFVWIAVIIGNYKPDAPYKGSQAMSIPAAYPLDLSQQYQPSIPQPSADVISVRPADRAVPSYDFWETAPPVGAPDVFTLNNIRYCKFQDARLNYVNTRISNNYQISGYNALIQHYNSRCSNYRYRKNDMTVVESELVSKDNEIRIEGERILTSLTRPSKGIQPEAPRRPQDILAAAPFVPYPSGFQPSSEPFQPNAEPTKLLPIADLLKLDDAIMVQARLLELGFLKGTADGTWGPQSRAALRAFRAANKLSPGDLWDADAARELFANDAIRNSPGAPILQIGKGDASLIQPPEGATLNPLNPSDAQQIHARLRALGFYVGPIQQRSATGRVLALKKTSRGVR